MSKEHHGGEESYLRAKRRRIHPGGRGSLTHLISTSKKKGHWNVAGSIGTSLARVGSVNNGQKKKKFF